MGEYKFLLLLILFVSSLSAQASVFQKDGNGMVRPFKVKEMKLAQFAREYASLTGTSLQVNGKWESELHGTVTLYFQHPIKLEVMTELFHQVLDTYGYGVVDAPGNPGWIIERLRDVRDEKIPIYDASGVPDTYRMVTVFLQLKYANAENIARMMRTFMSPTSRIIPASSSQVVLTANGRNIRKILKIVDQMDTQEVAKRTKAPGPDYGTKRGCETEQKIAKITVEKLEVGEMTNSPSNSHGNTPTPNRGLK